MCRWQILVSSDWLWGVHTKASCNEWSASRGSISAEGKHGYRRLFTERESLSLLVSVQSAQTWNAPAGSKNTLRCLLSQIIKHKLWNSLEPVQFSSLKRERPLIWCGQIFEELIRRGWFVLFVNLTQSESVSWGWSKQRRSNGRGRLFRTVKVD